MKQMYQRCIKILYSKQLKNVYWKTANIKEVFHLTVIHLTFYLLRIVFGKKSLFFGKFCVSPFKNKKFCLVKKFFFKFYPEFDFFFNT